MKWKFWVKEPQAKLGDTREYLEAARRVRSSEGNAHRLKKALNADKK